MQNKGECVSQAHSVRRNSTSLLMLDFIMQSLALYGQATKRIRWMPWQLEAMKDVEVCEKLGGADKQALYPEMSEWGNPPIIR